MLLSCVEGVESVKFLNKLNKRLKLSFLFDVEGGRRCEISQ